LKIKKYGGQYPKLVEELLRLGVLSGNPTQLDRSDLEYDDGIDINYKLKGMTPAKFREFSNYLLLLAEEEANRYQDEKWKFAKFEVALSRTARGRKMILPRRTYSSAKYPDAELMVWGPGYEPPNRKPLRSRVDEILNIPDSPSPGPYVTKQRPYRVLTMTICIRAGLTYTERQERLKIAGEAYKEFQKAQEEGRLQLEARKKEGE